MPLRFAPTRRRLEKIARAGDSRDAERPQRKAHLTGAPDCSLLSHLTEGRASILPRTPAKGAPCSKRPARRAYRCGGAPGQHRWQPSVPPAAPLTGAGKPRTGQPGSLPRLRNGTGVQKSIATRIRMMIRVPRPIVTLRPIDSLLNALRSVTDQRLAAPTVPGLTLERGELEASP